MPTSAQKPNVEATEFRSPVQPELIAFANSSECRAAILTEFRALQKRLAKAEAALVAEQERTK